MTYFRFVFAPFIWFFDSIRKRLDKSSNVFWFLIVISMLWFLIDPFLTVLTTRAGAAVTFLVLLVQGTIRYIIYKAQHPYRGYSKSAVSHEVVPT